MAQPASVQRAAVLRHQYQLLTAQLDAMCDQYDMWKIRHHRAIQHGQKAFQYSLYLRLITLDGCIQLIQNKIQTVATYLVVEMSMLGDLQGLEQLGIELID